MIDASNRTLFHRSNRMGVDMKIYPAILCSMMTSYTAMAQSDSSAHATATRTSPIIHLESSQAGVRLGATKVEQLGDAVGTYGIFANYVLGDNLLAGGAIDFWEKLNTKISDTSVQARDLSAVIDLKYVFTNVTRAFRPYLVAGAGAHRFEIREEPNQVKNLEAKYRDAVGKFGLDYGGGVSYRFDKSMDAVGEIRYRNVMDPDIALNQVALTGGLNYVL